MEECKRDNERKTGTIDGTSGCVDAVDWLTLAPSSTWAVRWALRNVSNRMVDPMSATKAIRQWGATMLASGDIRHFLTLCGFVSVGKLRPRRRSVACA